MNLYSLNKREIRSFRLRYKTLKLKNFFEDKNSFGFFIMTDAIQPKTRAQFRKDLVGHNLYLNNISKKVSVFLTKHPEWLSIKNLLIGNVILIKGNKTSKITNETLNFIMHNTQFNLRFLFWNQTLYRNNCVKTYIQHQHINHTLLLTQLIKKISLTPLILINPFLKRQN